MKIIQLEVHEFPVEGQKEKLKISEVELVFQVSRYKDVSYTQRQAQQQQGFSWSDMKKFKRIDEAIAKAESEGKKLLLELEDSDFDFVFENLKKMEWGNASKEFVKIVIGLVEKFEKAKEGKTEEAVMERQRNK